MRPLRHALTRAARVAIAGGVALLVVASAPAHAQQGTPDVSVLARQRELFDKANKLYDQQKLVEAEATYLEAWKLKRSFDVAGNLGNVEYDLKKWRQAAELLSYAIAELPAGTKVSARDTLVARLAEVEMEVGKLRVRVNRPGAEVFLDGTSIGVAPILGTRYVDPGTHVVEARLEGFPAARASVSSTKGRTEEIDLTLTEPGANRTLLIAGGATAGALAVVGAVLAGVWASEGSHASSVAATVPKSAPCPVDGAGATGTCATLKSDLQTRAALGSAAIASFAVAGSVGIATLTYGLVASPRRRDAARIERGVRIAVTPVATPQGGGLVLAGSFE